MSGIYRVDRLVGPDMLRIIKSKYDILRMLGPKQGPPHEEVWHRWTVIMPRRSITGRLLWGTVLRRRAAGFTSNVSKVLARLSTVDQSGF